MTYEMKDFQEDEKRLRKQAKDGEISEEEFFLALKKLHNRATEGDSHLVQLARSIGISEDELFSGEYGDNYDDILKNILDKAGITESRATEDVSFGHNEDFNEEALIGISITYTGTNYHIRNPVDYKRKLMDEITEVLNKYNATVESKTGVGSGVFYESFEARIKKEYTDDFIREIESIQNINEDTGIENVWIRGFESKANEGVHYTCPNCGNTDFSNESFEEYGEKRGSISCGNCGTVFTPMGDPTFGRRTVLGTVPKGQGSTYDILAKKYDWEAKANEMEEHECDDCGFKSVDYEEYKDHRKAHDKPVGSQGESIATEEEISDGIWLVDEEEQKELDKEKKRKEQNMNIDEDYMRSMGTVGSDEVNPLKVSDGVANEDNPCWDGYTQYGMKEKGGKQVPNCVKESKATEHDSLCPYCSKQIDDDDHWFEHIEKHRNGESRHHEQIDVKKKWLERCEVCGDIRSSHTNGIDHKFEVDATGTEFVNPKYLEMLGESILTKKNMSMEMVTFETMREAEAWWDKTHAGTHGRKYWKDMNIRERQKTILAYLKSVTGLGGKAMPLVEARASGVRKYALENKRIRFENPDPKFWWNDGEARTGTVLNEYRQSGLEWYSVNSGGQIYNVLKDDAELITGEVEKGLESCPECGNEVKDYLMKKHFENEHEEFINEHLWKDDLYLVENDHRNHSAIESDEEAKALLTDLTELDLLEDLKDNEKTEQTKGEDETEDLDLIEQLMDIEEDEIKEKIEEATPNSLIRYANPKKLPNGKTVMDRIRTSHPQVNESKLHSPIHISQYHQGDFSVTQICTECGLVIRGDPYSVDEESMQHVKETGHSTFKVEVEESIDVLGNIPFEAISTLAWNNLSPIIKEKIKQKISKEYWDDGTPTTTGEWWDMNDYEFKWSILKGFGSFAKSDELAKAYWRHLPDHVQNVVKRYRQIHFPDALGIEGISSNKNHNIDTYLEIAFQDFMKGSNSPNNRYEDTAYNKPNWDLGTVGNVDFGEAKANEDSLLKVEEEPEGVDVTVLDEWENKKADENDLEGLIDMYSDTTSIPRNPTYPSEPLGSGTDTEECPFCGNSFDEFNLDHHVEQEHGVHTPSQYTQSTIMNNLNDEWLGEAWDKMSAKERRKLLGETKVECSRCGQPLEGDDKEGQDKHAKNRHSEQGQASDNLDIGKVEWVPLGTYKPMYESKASEGYIVFNADGITLERYEDYEELDAKHYAEIIGGFVQEIADDNFDIDKHYSIAVDGDLGDIIYDARDSLLKSAYSPESKASEGGFGSGKKGHSAWMKDIEWGGNYKQCPICGINTNFTSGKCEICGNSFAGENWNNEYELIGTALRESPEDEIGRPILSYNEWENFAKPYNLNKNQIDSAWNKFGAWHWRQHINRTSYKLGY